MAELVNIKKPEYKDNYSDNSNESDKAKKQKIAHLRTDLRELYLTELHDNYLERLHKNAAK